MKTNLSEGDTNSIMQVESMDDVRIYAQNMARPRLDMILDDAVQCKLIYVIAGTGYGKTQIVRRYIDEHHDEAVIRWMQLTESDNIGSRYWEHLTHIISIDNPDLAEKLREIGFPDTLARFKQFTQILKRSEHRSHKTFLVLDDFHLIKSKEALIFAERCAHLQIPGACVIIISRTEPEIDVMTLYAKKMVYVISENELRFTDDEITDYLKWKNIPFSRRDVVQYHDITKGWALAVQMMGLILKRIPNNNDLAVSVMKQSIFKLFETEVFTELPSDIKKIMVQTALISDFPSALAGKAERLAEFIMVTPELYSFIWFDRYSGEYRIHPLFLEFLLNKQDILSDEEKLDTYKQAADWCYGNKFYTDAMKYFAESRQFNRMLELLRAYPYKLPHDMSEYCLRIIERIEPVGDEDADRSLVMLKNIFVPLLLVSCGKYIEAEEKAFLVIDAWKNAKTDLTSEVLYSIYGTLAYIDMFRCVSTHKYNAQAYASELVEYGKRLNKPPLKTTGPFNIAEIRSFATLVGENADISAFERFLESERKTISFISKTQTDIYHGYDDLVACELSFFRNQPTEAKNNAYQSIVAAREKKQYSIEAMALQYLLRISIAEGDYPLFVKIHKQLNDQLSIPDFYNRQLFYDLYTGFFYAQLGLPDMVSDWLIMDESEPPVDVRIPTREIIVGVKCHIALKQFDHALTVLCGSYPREEHERFMFGELTLTLLSAVAKINSDNKNGALTDFIRAYELSCFGEFEMPFIELGRNLHPLVVLALSNMNCPISDGWLKKTERKASAYAKKSEFIAGKIKRKKNIDVAVQITDRERDVLIDIYQGLTREDIAATRYLSVNTVKKILQSIYIKLDAETNIDAIRVALEKKLIIP